MKSGVVFNHNGGYEGNVLITAPDADDPKVKRQVRVDFRDLKALVGQYLVEKIEEEIEDLLNNILGDV